MHNPETIAQAEHLKRRFWNAIPEEALWMLLDAEVKDKLFARCAILFLDATIQQSRDVFSPYELNILDQIKYLKETYGIE